MNNEGLSWFRAKSGSEKFHRSRIMFCIKDGEIVIGPKNTLDSHFEWFEKEGWVTEENFKDFFNKNIRGYYIPSEDDLYCDIGFGFTLSKDSINLMKSKLPELKESLNLNDDTKVGFGLPEIVHDGKRYFTLYIEELPRLKELI